MAIGTLQRVARTHGTFESVPVRRATTGKIARTHGTFESVEIRRYYVATPPEAESVVWQGQPVTWQGGAATW